MSTVQTRTYLIQSTKGNSPNTISQSNANHRNGEDQKILYQITTKLILLCNFRYLGPCIHTIMLCSVKTELLEYADVFHMGRKVSKSRCHRIPGLITVFDAILTSRQSNQKLQWLYGNLIANNFFQNTSTSPMGNNFF